MPFLCWNARYGNYQLLSAYFHCPRIVQACPCTRPWTSNQKCAHGCFLGLLAASEDWRGAREVLEAGVLGIDQASYQTFSIHFCCHNPYASTNDSATNSSPRFTPSPPRAFQERTETSQRTMAANERVHADTFLYKPPVNTPGHPCVFAHHPPIPLVFPHARPFLPTSHSHNSQKS